MPTDWREMDEDVMDAPAGWDWIIGDKLAHHVWTLTERTPELGWGPDPPLLLEALMGFFPDRDLTDGVNSWFHTRVPGQSYTEQEWVQIPRKFQTASPDDRVDQTDILYDTATSPHPLRSKLHAQQYSATGAMFTYDFNQWQGEQPSGMIRVPTTSELLDEATDIIEQGPFEEFQYQSRAYRAQFADGPPIGGTFAHPHFRPIEEETQTLQDYITLFDRAVDIIQRSVRQERNQQGGV